MKASITGWSRKHLCNTEGRKPDVASCLYGRAVNGRRRSVTPSRPPDRSADAGQHVPQAIRRWGNSLAVRLPANCLRQAGLREGDQINIVVGPDGRRILEPLRKLDRSGLAADLRQLQATMPLTPSVIEDCRSGERW